MSDLNVVTLVGRLTDKPVLRYASTGLAITKFSIANNYFKKNSDGSLNTQTNFFNITVMGKQAENVTQYLDKGRQVAITGRLVQNKWQDKDGNNRYSVEVIASSVQFLGSKNDSLQSSDIPQSNSYSSYSNNNFQAQPQNQSQPQQPTEENIGNANNTEDNIAIENSDFESPLDGEDVPF